MTNLLNTNHPETFDEEYELIYVVASTGADHSELYPDDLYALGTFRVEVPVGLERGVAAAAALGAFHSTVPIKRIFDFEFEVIDESGTQIEPDEDIDWCETASELGAVVID